MDKKVLIISATGQVGDALFRCFSRKGYDVVGTQHSLKRSVDYVYLDLTDHQTIKDVFQRAQPDIVVLNAAMTHVDLCEDELEKAYAINVDGTRSIARECKNIQAKLVFFSSDYIFDGFDGPYDEEAVPNPLSVYGKTKLEGERCVQSILNEYIIVRTTWVFGKDYLGKNFVVRLVDSLSAGKSVSVPNDQVATPIYTKYLAAVVENLVAQDKTGIYNVAGPDRVSRYDFACIICDVFGLDKRLIKAVSTASLQQRAARPLSAGIVTDKIIDDSAVKVPSLKDCLIELKEECYD